MPLKRLFISGVIVIAGLSILAPTTALANPRKCHWDKTTGKLVCKRTQ
jgi:hypothetical protein